MTEPIQHEFYGDTFSFAPSLDHGWLLTTKEVAVGFGVTENAVRQQKIRHPEEIHQGKHYLKGLRPRVTECNARQIEIKFPNRHWVAGKKNEKTKRLTDSTIPKGPGNLQVTELLWTQKGVTRLGMFIKSSKAMVFRDWIESLVIEENQNAAFSTPQTYTEAVRDLLATLEERDTLALEVIELKPKALIADTIADSTGNHSMAEAAKMLGTGQNRLFKKLRGLQILIDRGINRNTPYQKFVDAGYFTVIVTTHWEGDIEIAKPTTRVTPKGIAWLVGKLN